MLFASLVPIDKLQADALADALYTEGTCAVRVDPTGVCVLFVHSEQEPYSLDLVCVTDLQTRRPQGMSRSEAAILLKWTDAAVRRICRAWAKRHPDGPRAPPILEN